MPSEFSVVVPVQDIISVAFVVQISDQELLSIRRMSMPLLKHRTPRSQGYCNAGFQVHARYPVAVSISPRLMRRAAPFAPALPLWRPNEQRARRQGCQRLPRPCENGVYLPKHCHSCPHCQPTRGHPPFGIALQRVSCDTKPTVDVLLVRSVFSCETMRKC